MYNQLQSMIENKLKCDDIKIESNKILRSNTTSFSMNNTDTSHIRMECN